MWLLSGDRQKAYNLINETSGPEVYTTLDITSVAELYNWLEEYSTALQVCESAIQTNKPEVMQPRFQANLAVSYHKTGAMVQAAAIIESLIKSSETSSVGSPEYFLACYYSWIGESDSAFNWLEKACESQSPEMPWLKVEPAFNSLKDDPRYWDLYKLTGHQAYDDYMASKNEH